VREHEPVATLGWMLRADGALQVVRAVSDPWKQVSADALVAWGEQRNSRITFREQMTTDDRPQELH